MHQKVQEKFYLLPIAVLTLCGLSVLMIIWANETKQNQLDHFMITDVVMDIQLQVALFGYEVEEHMNGEAKLSTGTILDTLRNAEKHADVLLEGGALERGYHFAPIRDTEIRAYLQHLKSRMGELNAISLQRLSVGASSAEGRRLDSAFDTVFSSIHETISNLKTHIEARGLQGVERARRIFWGLLSVWTVIVFSGGIGFWRLEKARGLMHNALLDNEEKYRSLVDSTDDSIYLVDRNYRYLFINKKHMSRLGLKSDEYLERSYSDFHAPEETVKFKERVDMVFQTGESFQNEHQSARDSGHFLQTLSPVKDLDGNMVAVTVISKNITHRKVIEEELRALSLTDELTGVYNRRGFFALAGQQLKIANRLKRGIYMLYADLNDLKRINDTFGHQEGDRALIEIANALKENFRESDIISRIGGDEFVVVPIETTGEGADVVTARLQKSLDDRSLGKSRGYILSLSVGIAFYDPNHPCSVDELLAAGDKLMYEQKKTKKPV